MNSVNDIKGNGFTMAATRERDITRAIARSYFEQFEQMIESDAIVVGSGPSGLVCARDLAAAGYKVLLLEQTNHLGGGFWNGGYLMNRATIAHPGEEILAEAGVPYEPAGEGVEPKASNIVVPEASGKMFLVNPAHACARLIAWAFDAGVRALSFTKVVDLVLRQDRLEGVVVNYAPVEALPHDIAHVDPIAFESRIVVDATGHDAALVELLAKRGLHAGVPGNGPMWVERSEALVVERTGEVFPNLWVAGLAVAAVYGTPRMGPAFGAMLVSGRVAARRIVERLAVRAGAPRRAEGEP